MLHISHGQTRLWALRARTIARQSIIRGLVKPRKNTRVYSDSSLPASTKTWNIPGLLGIVAGTATVTLVASNLWNHQPVPSHHVGSKYADEQGMLVVCQPFLDTFSQLSLS